MMGQSAPTRENRFGALKRLLQQVPPQHVPQRLNGQLFGEIARLEKKWEKDYDELVRVQRELPALRTRLEKLASPPLQHGVILALAKEPESGPAVVGVQGMRYSVGLAVDQEDQTEPQPCSEVLVNEAGRAVVKVIGKYERGESAEVLNILDPIHPPIELPTGETKNNPDCPNYPSDCKHYQRLHVRCGNNEGIVVETSPYIQTEEVNIGDIVRVDIRLAYAFEKLPSFEAGPLLLESDPNVSFDDIGGLNEQVELIREAIELPYLYRELFKAYHLQRPKGILLSGPPGCGKTLIAKAIATSLTRSIETHWRNLFTALQIHEAVKNNGSNSESDAAVKAALMEEWCLLNNTTPSAEKLDHLKADIEHFLQSHGIQLDKADIERDRITRYLEEGVKSYFLNVKGPELLDKYVGETEHKIRKVFDEAKRVASVNTPVVIFFDEMEAMFQTRGSGISSDMEKTIVPQLLAEMDGVEGMEDVLVIGASNRADLIDPAILRPGRLDIKIKIDRPNRDGARQILRIYLLPEEQALKATKKSTPKTDVPQTEVPAAEMPDTEVPRTEVAETEAPQTQMPDTEVPQTEVPETQVPQTEVPETEADENMSSGRLALSPIGLANEDDFGSLEDQSQKHRQIAEALIDETLDLIYSAKNSLHVIIKSGITRTFPLSNFVSGAILNDVVSRAKKMALKRRITSRGQNGAITFNDLREAVQAQFEENGEQMINSIPDFGKQEFRVKVVVGDRTHNKWDVQRPRPYQQVELEETPQEDTQQTVLVHQIPQGGSASMSAYTSAEFAESIEGGHES